ncbi:hypothetical protein [Actinophytocola glycyrrhizae]|uniref:ADP-ribosylglycohydrolase n=1 Tax=Actinophytocola glycyrrhizae TaxID=2044873 RepID=A0ABV9S9A1_9PSEU
MDVAEWLTAAAAVTCDRGLAVAVLSADLAAGALSPVESDGAKAVLAQYHSVLGEARDDDRHRAIAAGYFRDLAGSRPWAVPGAGDETAGMALAVQVDVLATRVHGDPEPLTDAELDDAIETSLTVVNGFPPFRPDHLRAVSLLSELTRQRYTRTRDPADLLTAMVAAEDLGKANEPGTADFVTGLLLHAAATAEWAHTTNAPDNLDVLIGLLEGQLADARAHGLEADVLRAIVMVRGVRLELEGEDAESVSQAIDEALRAQNQDSSAEGLVNYAGLVVRQALAAPSDEAFQAAVSSARRAVEAGARHNTAVHAAALGTLSYALRARFEFRGELQDIASAVTAARQAASLLTASDPRFPEVPA